jgi:diguanylate cyclase (GGDEF)-like protein
MGLFRRKAIADAPESEPLVPAEAALPGDSLADEALDALAQLLRVFGRDSFKLDDPASEPLAERCEQWARHVLTGAGVKARGDDEPAPGGDRKWPALRHFFKARRAKEASFVEHWLSESKAMISELLVAMSSLSGAGQQAEETIAGRLEHLEQAAQGDSLAELRSAVGGTIEVIRGAMDAQREHFDAELATMGSRLSSMREELLEARREMTIDPLTQVFNRRAFDDALEQQVALSSFSGHPLVLLMVDIDHFKAVNDSRGHTVGDAVLQEIAGRIVRVFPRRSDFVARYGGEEFAVILPEVDAVAAPKLAERVLQAVRERSVDVDPPLTVTCSVGYALLRKGEAAAELLSRADQALYGAKHGGRDRAVSAELAAAGDPS